MVLLSTLRTPAIAGVRSALSRSSKGSLKPTNIMQVRYGGGGGPRKMEVTPSKYLSMKVKDEFYFYMTLGLIPVVLFVTYQNVRYGPAVLKEIPEDYHPESWEYYRDPVKRWMSKHRFYDNHAKEYERTAYFVWKANEERLGTMKMKKVKQAMNMKPTQREWYLVPDTMEDRKIYNEKMKEKFERGLNVNKWV